MVLEAVMIVVDNSESSRNGDYAPTRYDAQADSVGIIFQHVVQGNPESSVGLLSMGGKGPEVLVTLTTDQGKILDGLHRTKKTIRGSSHLATGIQVAGLALKHRQNKAQRQRIVVFVCSPILESEAELVKLAKRMKKSAVNVDFVLFGELEDDNEKKLRAFIDAVKNGETSHLEIITPGPQLLSDRLISTPILLGENAAPSGSGGAADGAAGGMDMAFDAADDPELALALRMSLEEENARQEKARREEEAAANKSSLESVEEESATDPLLGKDDQSKGIGGKKGDSAKDGKSNDDSDKMDTS